MRRSESRDERTQPNESAAVGATPDHDSPPGPASGHHRRADPPTDEDRSGIRITTPDSAPEGISIAVRNGPTWTIEPGTWVRVSAYDDRFYRFAGRTPRGRLQFHAATRFDLLSGFTVPPERFAADLASTAATVLDDPGFRDRAVAVLTGIKFALLDGFVPPEKGDVPPWLH